MLPHEALGFSASTVRVAFRVRTPRASDESGTGDARCISRGFCFLSSCVVQRMRVWSLPALLFLSEPVCRSVGRRPEARAHGGKAIRPHPLRHPSRRIPLGSRRNSARCAARQPPPRGFKLRVAPVLITKGRSSPLANELEADGPQAALLADFTARGPARSRAMLQAERAHPWGFLSATRAHRCAWHRAGL